MPRNTCLFTLLSERTWCIKPIEPDSFQIPARRKVNNGLLQPTRSQHMAHCSPHFSRYYEAISCTNLIMYKDTQY